jgi:threonine dehydrogenase-like Zn-dependent dehydrogenase
LIKALVAYPPKKDSARLIEIPKPSPKDSQVLLKTLYIGIDGTDREINEGVYGIPPINSRYLILGHEALAKIEEIGIKVEGFSEGDLVVPTVRRPCVENCLNCRKEEVDMCLTGNYFEHGIYKLHGFASEYALSDVNFLVKVPYELKDVGVLLEPLSIVEKAVIQTFKIQERMMWEPEKAFVVGCGPLGLLATVILRLKGLEVYAAATKGTESLKAKIVNSVGATYINVRETPMKTIQGKFDLIIEATGKVEPTLEALDLLRPNGVMCFLGIYREKKTCKEFGKVLTNMVLGNRLMFGSVSSNKTHFEKGINDMIKIKSQYGNFLNKLITRKLHFTNFKRAFEPKGNEIKTLIYFFNN